MSTVFLAACAPFHWSTDPHLHHAAGLPGAGAPHGPRLGHRHHHLQVRARLICHKSEHFLTCSLIYFVGYPL